MNRYDVIIVGSGNSALISALSLLNKGYKVLILDEHNNVGGLSKGLVKGRFEFETSIHNQYLVNSDEKYKLDTILKNCNSNVKINFSPVSELFRVITPDVDYTMPFGVNKYIDKLEEYVPNSRPSIELFFELAKECREALNYVVEHKNELDYDYIKEQYNNFMRVSSYSVSKVLDALNMPLEAQEIINVMWIYFGSAETEISFVEYAVFLLNVIESGLQIPTDRSYDISMSLANDFLERGGEIRLNTKVNKLIIDEDKINGVVLSDGIILYANKVIVNSSLINVYGKLINPEDASREALMNVNSRKVSGKLFTVHLGLNRSAEELGLTNYSYIIYHSLDSDLEQSKMKMVNSGNQISTVLNNAVKDASPEGTCIVSLNTLFFEDGFDNYIDNERYYVDIYEMAQRLIEVFQKYTKVRIADYIEEIEIVSPINNAAFNDCPEGSTYGFKLSGNDNLLPRILNSNREKYIDGLEIIGGFDGDIYGYNSSLMSGYTASLEILDETEGDL